MLWTSSGLTRGLLGRESKVIRASLGVRPPFRLLHRKQQQTMFSQVVGPPWERGMT